MIWVEEVQSEFIIVKDVWRPADGDIFHNLRDRWEYYAVTQNVNADTSCKWPKHVLVFSKVPISFAGPFDTKFDNS